MRAKKGQTFNRYSEDTKKEAVRLRVGEGWAYSRIMEKFGIKSEIQIIFSSAEEENAYLKAQVEYLKKLNPNLHGREAGFRSPVQTRRPFPD